MRSLRSIEFQKISAGIIDLTYSVSQGLYLIKISPSFGSKNQVLILDDLTFTIKGCSYFGSPIIPGAYYSGYKIEVQISPDLPGSLGAANYKLTKV